MRAALFAAVVAIVAALVILVVKSRDSQTSQPVAGSTDVSPSRSLLPQRSPTLPGSAGPPQPHTEAIRERVSGLRAQYAGSGGEDKRLPEVETAVADAYAALTAGDPATALAGAEQVLAREPSHKGMQRVAGQAACALGKADVAQRYSDAGDQGTRAAIGLACTKHGITLTNTPKRVKIVPEPKGNPN